MTELLKKYKSLILYVIFGGLTTVVDWSISFLLYYLWGDAIEATPILLHGANVIAWVAAVAFAYVTNRIWVFASGRHGFGAILFEFLTFAGSRISTLLLQELTVFLLFDLLAWDVYAVKIIAAVLVVIANYFISKFLVFRREK